jgi:hypothetical protein
MKGAVRVVAGHNAAAVRRVRTFLARLDRLDRDDLQRVGLPMPNASRVAARDRAVDAAIVAGRRALMDDARRAVVEGAFGEYAKAGYRPTWLGTLNWGISTGRAEDHVAAALALEDAAIAAVAEDLVPADDVDELTAAYDLLARGATGGPPSESLPFALSSRPGRIAALAFLVFAVFSIGVAMTFVIGPAGLVAAAAVIVGVVSVFRVRASRVEGRQ